MSVSLRLLLSDYERARAAGDSDRAKSIFKEMEKIGLPDRLKPKPVQRKANTRGNKPQPGPSKQAGIKIDPGRF